LTKNLKEEELHRNNKFAAENPKVDAFNKSQGKSL
jgi:hypothetical protein